MAGKFYYMTVVKDDNSTDDNNDDDTGKELSVKCTMCGKVFESNYILNYHNLLEHSKYKRPPIGIS